MRGGYVTGAEADRGERWCIVCGRPLSKQMVDLGLDYCEDHWRMKVAEDQAIADSLDIDERFSGDIC